MALSPLAHRFAVLLLACVTACAPPAPHTPGDATILIASDGTAHPLSAVLKQAPWTVAVFVSKECPCLAAHDQRLRDLAATYGPRGVQFLAIDSEVGTTPGSASAEIASHGLPFSIYVDRGAKLANELGAEFATYTVVLASDGRVVYRGGIDSDKQRLHDDATFFLRDALDDLLVGHAPRRTEGKTLGCVLRKW